MQKEIKVGEFVQIIARVEEVGMRKMYWNTNGEMDQYLNDGNWYEVLSYNSECVVLQTDDDKWTFLSECLSNSIVMKDIVKAPIELKKAKPPIKKKVKTKKRSLRAIVEEQVKKQEGIHISSYAVRSEKEEDCFHINDVCYARLSRVNNSPIEVAVSLGNSERIIGKKNMRLYRKYAKYILESPCWGLPFLTRNVNTAFRYGILMDVNQPLSRIMGSLTALRVGVEFSYKLNLFDKMLKAGYSGDVAYFISSTFMSNGKGNNYTLTLDSSGHKILIKDHSLKGIIDFFQNGYRDLKELPYKKETIHFQCQRAVCTKNGNLRDDILKNCVHTTVGDGWDSSTTVTEKDLFKFADVLTEMIGKK